MEIDGKVVAERAREILKEYVKESGIRSLVIGVSGGVDSAVCCALAYPVCIELGIPLLGISIPIDSNKQDEIQRAKLVGESLCTKFQEIDKTAMYKLTLGDIADRDKTILADNHAARVRRGNIKARMRMIELYDAAQATGGMVLSTDNLTEYLLGFWTLHGDVGDFGMIQELWKMEVYQLATYLAKESEASNPVGTSAMVRCAQATPTDGLGVSESDLEQLGAESYEKVDDILNFHTIIGYRMPEKENCPVIQRHKASRYKRDNPFNIKRSMLLDEEDDE